VPDEERFAGTEDQLRGRGREVAGEVTADENLEAEAKGQQAEGKGEELSEKVKEKGKDVLDKIAGPDEIAQPDVPPTVSKEEKRD
jgi:uncharacterized protein YjbJ (UPF0337 family)